MIGSFKAPFLKRDSCVGLCVGVAPLDNGRVVIKRWSAHFVSLLLWYAFHSWVRSVYDGSANDDKSSFFGCFQHESPVRVQETPSAFHRHAQPNAERRRDARQQRQRDVTKNGANAQTRDKMTTRQTAKIMNVSPGLRPVLAYGIQTRKLPGVRTNMSGNSIIFGPLRKRHL